MACGIKLHLIFIEKINCAVSFDVKLVPLLLNIDHSVRICLKDLNKALIQAAKSYDGTDSKHILRINENFRKNTIAL